MSSSHTVRSTAESGAEPGAAMVNVKSKLIKLGEQIASCPLGQIIFRFADRFLWTIENSVQWFMKNDELKSPRVRPLPWLLFLPLLLFMRIIKMYFDLFSYLGRKDSPTATKVVSSLQGFRRKLRAIKYAGLKNFRAWEAQKEEKKEGKGMFIRLFGLSWLATFTGIGRIVIPAKVLQERQLKPIKDVSYSSDTDTGTALEELNKTCAEDVTNEDDPDYEPPSEHSAESEDSDTSSSSSTLSLQTADAGSETTSPTFYSSSNVTPEPPNQKAHTNNVQSEYSNDEVQTAVASLSNGMKELNLNDTETVNHKEKSDMSEEIDKQTSQQVENKTMAQAKDEIQSSVEDTQKPGSLSVSNTNESISQIRDDKLASEAILKQTVSVNNLNESVLAKDHPPTTEGTQNSISVNNLNGSMISPSKKKLNCNEDTQLAVNSALSANDVKKKILENNDSQQNSIST